MILSVGAIAIISKAIKRGKYRDHEGEREPPLMAPSTDPDDYSLVCDGALALSDRVSWPIQWCSLCNDYGKTLVLCAGCRTGVCCSDTESDVGCLQWEPVLNTPEFVFYCPYCSYAKRRKPAVSPTDWWHVPGLDIECVAICRLELPRMWNVWFRYDPPVIVIGVTWHQTREPFTEYFHRRLALSYYDDTDLVSVLPLLGSLALMQRADTACGRVAARV